MGHAGELPCSPSGARSGCLRAQVEHVRRRARRCPAHRPRAGPPAFMIFLPGARYITELPPSRGYWDQPAGDRVAAPTSMTCITARRPSADEPATDTRDRLEARTRGRILRRARRTAAPVSCDHVSLVGLCTSGVDATQLRARRMTCNPWQPGLAVTQRDDGSDTTARCAI